MSPNRRGARRSAIGTVFLLASMLAGSPHATAAASAEAGTASHRPGELLVKLRPGVAEVSGRALLRGHGAQKMNRFRRPRRLREAAIERWWHVKLAPGQDVDRVIERLSKHADVERVEPNYELSMDATPNDPLFGQLWGLHNAGQTGGTPDADIDAPEAWDVDTGSNAVVVAVVDTGIDYTHPDLAANIWTNPGEIPGNGIDDDGNGYVDDVHGYDFVNNDGNPFDDNGHGTHVSGTIAAAGDNGVGVAGVNWRARVMALKFLNAGGSGGSDAAIRALLYAADMGAVVINNSWGGGGFSQALLDAVRATDAAGALFVAAAGNSNRDIDLVPTYPASYEVENVLAVAAVDHNDARAFFSNFGAKHVHLAAPGVSILSTVPFSGPLGDPSGYRLLDGTSMATPHVSGAAALLRSHFPTLTGRELKLRLMATAEPVASMAGLTVTGGRLNIANPLIPDPVPPAGVADLAATAAASRRVGLSWTAPGGDGSLGQASRYDVRYSTTPITEATFDGAARALAPRPAAAGATETLTLEGLEPGTRYYFALKAFDQAGNASVLSNVAAADTGDEVVLYRDAFESGAPGWTVEGSDGNGGPALWHLSTHMAASPTHAFYYGREPQLNYSTGAPNFGSLTSPPISLAGSAEYLLSFQHFLDNESHEGYDRARVLVSSDDGVTWTPLWTRYIRTSSVFEQVLVDLSSYDGQVIRLRFEFDTINNRSNWFEGWVIDDVVVLAAVAAGGNQAPIADAGGLYTGRRHLDVTFDGSGSTDPEGDPISYRWDFGDGAVSVGPNPTHAYQTTGTFDVRLVVNDGARNSASSTTTATVTAPGPELVLHVTTDSNGHGGVRVDPSNEVCDAPVPFASRTCYHYFEPGTVVTLTPVIGSTSVVWSGACSGTGSCQISMTGDKELGANFEGPKPVSISLNSVAQGVGTVRMQAPDGTFDCSVTEGSFKSCSYQYPVGTVVTLTAVAGPTSYFQGWQDTQGCSGTGPCQFTVTGNGAHAPFLGPRPLTVDVLSSLGGVGTVNVVNPPSGSCSGLANSQTHCQFLIKPGATVTLAPAAEPGSRFLGWDGACNSLGTCQVTMPITATPGPSLFAVFGANRPPTARAGGPYSGVRQQAISFNGSASTDLDGDALTYQWTFGDGATATGVAPTHAYATLGTFAVTLTVRDGFGGVGSASTTAAIVNRAPTARPGGPYSGVRRRSVAFSGAASTDPDGDALTYEWTFGDGAAATGVSPTHTYQSAGTYTVTLRVRDVFGATATASTTAVITQN